MTFRRKAKLTYEIGHTRGVFVSPNPTMHRPMCPRAAIEPIRREMAAIHAPTYRAKTNLVGPSRLKLHKDEELVSCTHDPARCAAILEKTLVPGCDYPAPHMSPLLRTDVLITSSHDGMVGQANQGGVSDLSDWHVAGKVKHAGYNFTDMTRRQGFRILKESVVVVSAGVGGSYCFHGAFITSNTDPRLPALLSAAPEIVKMVSEHIQIKDKKWSRASMGHNAETLSGYVGSLWNDGLQYHKYFNADLYGFTSRLPGVLMDAEYMASMARWCSVMSHIHADHAPGIRGHVLATAKSFKTPSVVLGFPIELAPHHTMGISTGFANDIHNDSSAVGHCECISYYRGKPVDTGGPGTGWGFALWGPRIMFDLGANPASCVYVPGRETHGTVPTGRKHVEHHGIGSVGFMRSSVLSSRWRRLKATQHAFKDGVQTAPTPTANSFLDFLRQLPTFFSDR